MNDGTETSRTLIKLYTGDLKDKLTTYSMGWPGKQVEMNEQQGQDGYNRLVWEYELNTSATLFQRLSTFVKLPETSHLKTLVADGPDLVQIAWRSPVMSVH